MRMAAEKLKERRNDQIGAVMRGRYVVRYDADGIIRENPRLTEGYNRTQG